MAKLVLHYHGLSWHFAPGVASVWGLAILFFKVTLNEMSSEKKKSEKSSGNFTPFSILSRIFFQSICISYMQYLCFSFICRVCAVGTDDHDDDNDDNYYRMATFVSGIWTDNMSWTHAANLL